MNINDKRFRKKFERLANKLSKTRKYHIHRSLSIKENGELYYSRWDIYLRLDDWGEYFSDKNQAILSSTKGDTLNDIKKLIREENKHEFIQRFIPRK